MNPLITVTKLHEKMRRGRARRMMNRKAQGLAAGFAAAAIAAPAAADEIVVTATKRAQPFEDVPASVSVISGAMAERAGALGGGEEVARLLSGVQAAVANGSQPVFQIRGVGAVDHQALTPSAAAVYVDGVFLATNVQAGPLLYDIERVEVLKGPQGALYGRNASSGAVHFVTIRPGDEISGYARAAFGKYGRADVAAAAGGPIGNGFSVRIAGRALRQDPALDNIAGPERAGGVRDEFGVRGALAWTDERDTKLLVRVHYEEDNGVNPAPRNLDLDLSGHRIAVGPDGVQDTDNEFYGASIEIESRVGGWELFSLTAIEGYNQQYGFDFDGTPAPFGIETLNANLSYDRDYLQWSQELRLHRSWSRGHSLIGVTGAGEDFEQDYLIWCGDLDPQTLLGTCPYVGAAGRVGPAPVSDSAAMTLLTHIEQERRTAAVFTYHELELTDRLRLTLGGRFTHETIKGSGDGRHFFADGAVGFNNRDGVGPAVGEARIEENRLSGNAALSYRLPDGALAYAAWSNGYKSGGFNGEVQNNAAHFHEQGLFGAETVNAVEAGYKAKPFAGATFAAAGFYYLYDAPQARVFVNFPLPDGAAITSNSLSNLDAARVFGLEASLDWRPSERIQIGASATAMRSRIRQESDIGGNAALFDGNPLPFAPEFSAVLYGRGEQPVGDGLSLALQANAKYQSGFYLDPEGRADRRQKGYVLADVEAGLVFERSEMEIAVWAENILDKDYAVSGFGFIGYNVFIGAPRSYGVRISKKF